MILATTSSLYFGHFVDHHTKKTAMLVSSIATLAMYVAAALVFYLLPEQQWLRLDSVGFWLFVLFILGGSVMGNMRSIALSTTVTLLVEPEMRDKANGMVGTVNGVAFAITSVFSGLVIGMLGMHWAIAISVILTTIATLHLLTIAIPEKLHEHKDAQAKKMDVPATIKIIRSIPGLVGLIVFTTFNNLLGGVFMALMDAYGLSLVSVEVWGTLWAFLSTGFIIGGLVIAKNGLSTRPLRTLLLANVAIWSVTIFFTIRSSIILTAIGNFIYLCIIPVIEAVEQTVVQRLVPLERQGRVFGFAHSIESAASPVTALLIGPIAQLFFIPFMETGNGVAIFGPLLGEGPNRGIALVFTVAGIIGLLVTLAAFSSKAYRTLSAAYERAG